MLNAFCRRDFTFVCPTEIIAFNDALPQFKELGATVLGIFTDLSTATDVLIHMSLHLTGISTDSKFSHFAWSNQPRKQGGLGPELKLPLVADRSMQISRDYGVLLEDEGIALRGLFLIDPKGILRWGCLLTINHQSAKLIAVMSLRQITVNDLPVGRSVDETIRLIKAFQFTVCFFWLIFLVILSTVLFSG